MLRVTQNLFGVLAYQGRRALRGCDVLGVGEGSRVSMRCFK